MVFKSKVVFVFLLVFCGIFLSAPVMGQKKLMDKLIHKFLSNEKDTVKKNTFFPFPVASMSPETGLEYGVAALYSFYLEKEDTATRVSTINIMATHTTHNQSKAKIVSDVWSRDNQYHYSSELRYWDFPYSFYGIGANTWKSDKESINEKRARLTLAVDKQLAKNYYAGLETGFEYFKNSGTDPDGIYSANQYFGKSGGKRIYFGVRQSYDSRDKVTYTTKGLYGNLRADYTPGFFSGEQYTGWQMAFDGRYFTPLTDKVVLALNGVYEGIYGSQVPFYMMSQLGGENTMRGYYQGRFRDKNMATMQAEIKYRFVPRFALVGFGGAGTVFGDQPLTIHHFKPNYGAGIRYFFDLNKDLSLRIDYGFGEKRAGEGRLSGFYFSMDEAF
ncbi:hypothetical protein SAMN05192529_1292 [Arachidicoccus rhizosphaerae]|uniref:Bacterial surface antigen (D15) domain-containing protein n=2 Tax=Arachidicoccus rhizosphaerae TaxID=551991 RepID=A0A1H4C9I4_9BACT|nr:hypothetical protein SAMN05192529_1292 [Arachidicoccus rhizosphaerae]